jgi:hypothetical protein
VPLQRINLNVPAEIRDGLRAVAKRLNKTESEVARDLLVEGLRRKEKEAFYEKVSQQMTPALRSRLLEISEALEGFDG